MKVTDFDTLAARLNSELERIFTKYPDIDPHYQRMTAQSLPEYLRQLIICAEETKRVIGKHITLTFEQLADTVSVLGEIIRRMSLYHRLIEWHTPDRIAEFISDYWPRKLLPMARAKDFKNDDSHSNKDNL